MRFLWGLLTIGIGIAILKYTYGIVQTFGTIRWAEDKLGGGMGGTYTLWKIIGLVVIFLGFMYMFGLVRILTGPLEKVF